MSKFTRSEVLLAWRVLLVLYCIHGFGRGMYGLILYEFILLEISRGNLVTATAVFGSQQVVTTVVRLASSTLTGALADRFGRRAALCGTFLSDFVFVALVFFLPSTETLFAAAAVLGLGDIADIAILSSIGDMGSAMTELRATHAGGGSRTVVPAVEVPDAAKSSPHEIYSSDTEVSATQRDSIASTSSELYGYVSAVWVVSAAIGAVGSSVVVKLAAGSNETTELATNATLDPICPAGSVRDAASSPTRSIGELLSSAYIALGVYFAAFLLATVAARDTSRWEFNGVGHRKEKRATLSPIESFKLLFKSRWLGIITLGLMTVEAPVAARVGDVVLPFFPL